MAPVAEEPPEALGAAHVAAGDDEGAVADSRPAGGGGERVRVRQWVTAARAGFRREIGVDVEEARTWNVSREIELTPTARIAELPAAVDELVAPPYQLPPGDGGSWTDAGWIT